MKVSNPIKILIADDHVVFVNGLSALLKEVPNLEIVATAFNGEDALDLMAKHSVDLIITDISMPRMNGIEFLERIKVEYPDVNVMVLSMHNEAHIVKSVLKLDPNAYLLKNTDSQELIQAIGSISAGQVYYGEEVKTVLINNLRGVEKEASTIHIPTLSKREKEVLNLIAQEKTTPEIAEELFLSLHTIETYRKNLLRKLEAKNSVGLVAKAYQYGLME